MPLGRRQFLTRTGLALTAGALPVGEGSLAGAAGIGPPDPPPWSLGTDLSWEAVRGQFALSDDWIHMSALFIASHPRVVREAIARHRRALDRDPVVYLQDNNERFHNAALAAAADYMGAGAASVALTDSTTMGIGLVYTGLRLSPDDVIVSSEDDYYVTHEAIRLARERTGAQERRIALYDRVETASAAGIVERVRRALTARTRVLALTWVHSNTGLKIPVRAIADAVAEINAEREENDRVLFCLDGVHGFGNQDADIRTLGCDVFMAGCHKWLFGPRGTGIVVASDSAWRSMVPAIPSFTDNGTWHAWLTGAEPPGPTSAAAMTPGGFKAFEHRWALTQAFDFHRALGKDRIEGRTRSLARRLKEGLAEMGHIRLRTPMSDDLSAGIVCFDVEDMAPGAAVERLRERRIVATTTPYARQHVRLAPSIRNTPEEVERALREIHKLTP